LSQNIITVKVLYSQQFNQMGSIIQVEHLSKSFSDFKAVDDLTFTVEPGEVYGFLGKNGAGKSTTIRMLLTLIKPTSGQIKIFGSSITENRKAILKNIGAIIEKSDVYKYLSAYDNMKIFGQLSAYNPTKKQIEETLTMVGLDHVIHKAAKTFSQGMKQRLGIAIALIHNPQLIILDEPTNGLDPQGITEMRNLIISLSKDHGKTVMVSSHLLYEMEQMATSMIIIHKGKKIVEGKTKELLNLKKNWIHITTANDQATKALLDQKNITTKLADRKLLVELANEDIPAINQLLVENGVQVYGINSQDSLENYFLSLTSN
jgi:ABC-type multidrug transport system ATPase subunit